MVTDIPEHTEVNLLHLSGHIMSPLFVKGHTLSHQRETEHWSERPWHENGQREIKLKSCY